MHSRFVLFHSTLIYQLYKTLLYFGLYWLNWIAELQETKNFGPHTAIGKDISTEKQQTISHPAPKKISSQTPKTKKRPNRSTTRITTGAFSIQIHQGNTELRKSKLTLAGADRSDSAETC